jgi:hypothetical protein
MFGDYRPSFFEPINRLKWDDLTVADDGRAGNGAVFRGRVQPLWVVFSRSGKRAKGLGQQKSAVGHEHASKLF